jgi:hypothetical protein
MKNTLLIFLSPIFRLGALLIAYTVLFIGRPEDYV